MADDLIPGFPGFPPQAMRFLGDLRDNNDRAWFTAHRETYDQAIRGPAEAFLACLEPALASLTGGPVSGKIFRIHRDVRFSKDKRPYNAHLHIAFPARSGAGDVTACGFYFGLEPERVLLGAGGFDFAGPVLDAYRAAAADPVKGAALESILARLAASGLRIEGAELKRVRQPYAQDHPRAALLRRKGLNGWRDLTDPAFITSEALFAETLATFETLTPLVKWLADL
ncbi:DUF2461 domain-containing protein [Phenylobacterium sp.]|jgi:uncharacterized protein (TIGR02453 family)|uniref:DUF2461 domain-containing protein n=1 Tax=Phenylobacterium sp. TaxID=1871053 RepID=UPI002E344F74|nr:DUF2461 domain-containing protein [Phenylobacterium sp.]HEX4711952.1 DUF2461 domain-containing protein [Phenylobacterium sp.]